MFIIQFEDRKIQECSFKELETYKHQNMVKISEIGFKFVAHFHRFEYFDGVVTKNMQMEDTNTSLMMVISKSTQWNIS